MNLGASGGRDGGAGIYLNSHGPASGFPRVRENGSVWAPTLYINSPFNYAPRASSSTLAKDREQGPFARTNNWCCGTRNPACKIVFEATPQVQGTCL